MASRILFLLLISISSFAQTYVPLYGPSPTSGTNTIVQAYAPTPTLSEGFKVIVYFTNAPTGASTLNVGGTGAVELLTSSGSPISSGDINSGTSRWVVYRNSKWRLIDSIPTFGLTPGNGTTVGADLTSIDWGGTLTSNATINMGAKTVFFNSTNNSSSFAAYAGSIQILGGDLVGGNNISRFDLNSTQANYLLSNDGGSTITAVTLNSAGGVLFTDALSSIGSGYNADYHINGIASFGNRWVTDVGYVLGAKTFTGKQTFVASGTGAASINIPDATAPTSPGNGDLWGTTSHLYMRLGGVSYQLDRPTSVGTITAGTWNSTTIAADFGGTGHANNAASTITISGNFGTTFTISGTTSVTLPTAGTLATRAGTETFTNKSGNISQWTNDSGYLTTVPGGLATQVIATDANITASSGTVYHLPSATLSTNRTINVSGISTSLNYVEFVNNEAGFVWSFTGASVYLSDGTTTVTNLLANTTYQLRYVNGKLRVIN